MSDAIMPGAWICDKCGFILQNSTLHVLDGGISADMSKVYEICPNDMERMRGLTWREVNENLYNEVLKLRKEIAQLKGESYANYS